MSDLPADLDGTRARSTSYMRARCVVERPSEARPVLNRGTGAIAVAAPTRIYPAAADPEPDGICSVQEGPGIGTAVREEGGEDTAVRSWVLRLPFDSPAAHLVRRGDVVRITLSDNPQLVEHPMVVHAPDLRGRQVTVMLTLTERSYQDVAP